MKSSKIIWIILLLGMGFSATLTAQKPFRKSAGQEAVRKSAAVINTNPLLDNYDVKFYGLDVEVDTTSDFISGNTTILVSVENSPMSTLVFELFQMLEVEKIIVNGEEVSFSHEGDEVIIPISEPVDTGELVLTQIFYAGQTGEGMVTETDKEWDIPVTFTLSEPFYAKDWFPCKEKLEDKADSVHVFITTDYGLKAASNGILTGTTYFPNGKVRHEWKSNYPIAFYLISIAVADYIDYSIEAHIDGIAHPILIQNYIYNRPLCLDTYKDQIDATVQIMDVFCELFGPYPFAAEKYGHYLWPWGGGMEHQTMTGIGSFNFSLVAHELGHSWFGDYVTCATWQDIWINEGFATYAANLATERLANDYASGERAYWFGRALNEPGGSVYVPVIEADNDPRIFNGNLSYGKGMALVHMIRFELKDDVIFFQSLRKFITRYANNVATGLDFKEVLEETTGRDFTDFFNQWYFGAGYPIFELNWEQQGTDLTLRSIQTTSSEITTLFRTSMEYKIYYSGGDTTVRVFHGVNEETYQFFIPHNVDSIQIDPNDEILNMVSGIEGEPIKKGNGSHFHLYPNPTQGNLSIQLPEGSKERVTLKVYNGSGQLVLSRLVEGRDPFTDFTVNMQELAPGLYFIKVDNGTSSELKKILLE